MNPSVLHICSYYTGQKLYGNLFRSLSQYDITQHIYIPVRTYTEIGQHQIHDTPNLYYYYTHVLKPWHRFLYFTKINKTYKVLQEKIDISKLKLTHAHCLFSDGGVALKLNKDFGIPFIVAVRNTDVNVFLKKMPHLRAFALTILREAKYIVFINPTLRQKIFERYIPKKYFDELSSKCVCIPNGIDDFWHSNKVVAKKFSRKKLNLLYVGAFVNRKNLPLVIEAAKSLSGRYDVVLTVIGGGGDANAVKGDKEVLRAIENAKASNLQLDLVGQLDDRERLRKYYRIADVFVMPSRNETFGLVYIEALSQGTPIIYTMDDGVGGLFDEGEVGYGIKSFSVKDVVKGIEDILHNYEAISKRCIEASSGYNWDELTGKYLNLYKS